MLSKRSQSLINAHKRKRWGFVKGQGFWLGKKFSGEHREKIKRAGINRIVTEETKLKISNALKGKTKSLEHREKLRIVNLGKKASKETKRKMQEAHWRKGIGYNTWKRFVLERDNYTCRECGISDKRVLHVDHVKSKSHHPELEFEVTNGMTLCANCHMIKTIENKEYNVNHKRNAVHD